MRDTEGTLCAECATLPAQERAAIAAQAAAFAALHPGRPMMRCRCSAPWDGFLELHADDGSLTLERPLPAQMTWRALNGHLWSAVDGFIQNATEALLFEGRPTVAVCAGCVAEMLTAIQEVADALSALRTHFGPDAVAVAVGASGRYEVPESEENRPSTSIHENDAVPPKNDNAPSGNSGRV